MTSQSVSDRQADRWKLNSGARTRQQTDNSIYPPAGGLNFKTPLQPYIYKTKFTYLVTQRFCTRFNVRWNCNVTVKSTNKIAEC